MEQGAKVSTSHKFTTHKRSLGQGNVLFACVILFARGEGSRYDVTSCLGARSHVPSGDSLSLVPCCFRGGGQRPLPRTEPPPPPPDLDRDPRTVKSGRYASYWNAFLFDMKAVHVVENVNMGFSLLSKIQLTG